MLVAATLELSQRFSLRLGNSVSTEQGVSEFIVASD